MKTTAVVAAVATGVMASTTALALATSAQAAPNTQVLACGQTSIKPDQLVLACADANSLLTKIKWSSWTNGNAKGKATYQENNCEPTCVAGTFVSYPAEVQLTSPKKVDGERVFTKVTITFPDGGPGSMTKMMLPLVGSL